tara:strand:+ start:113 stop:655 length:543 start_codon:yes stop_codon:yes gene_type:complete
MWQGIMPGEHPRNTEESFVEKISSTIEHDLTMSELMGHFSISKTPGGEELKNETLPGHLVNTTDRELPNDLRWMIFKVKQKAETSYHTITRDTTDDSKFKFQFVKGEKSEPPYSYNWPYDFFSLIELAKLDVEPTIKATAALAAIQDASGETDDVVTPTDLNADAIAAIAAALGAQGDED